MHVAILCEYGTVNGGENSILAMLQQLPNWEFSVLAPSAGRLKERLLGLGIRHIEFSRTGPDVAEERSVVLDRLSAIITEVSPDLLHGNSLAMGRLTGMLAGKLAMPTSAHLRDILRLSRTAITELNRNDRLFAVSQATQDFHVGQGLDAARVQVQYNGIDTSVFHPRQRTGWLHDELGIPTTSPLVVTIGQISLRKGQDVLIESAVLTAAELPDVHWLIIGERYSEKQESRTLEAEMHQRVTAAGLEGRVQWLGYREDIPALLPEVDLLVHSARQEPLGRVLLEAAACGVPIIATAVGGTTEILDEESAVLVEPDDPGALSAAMQRLLGNRQRRSEISAAAQRVVRDRFPIEERAQDLARQWTQLIEDDVSRMSPSKDFGTGSR